MTSLRPTRAPPGAHRIVSIDFWRGVVLCTIFVNHVPGNVFEFLTQKNFGFSDSAEAFVFLSGVSLALAYATRVANGATRVVAVSMARRAVRLYGVHILLSLAGIAIFAAGAMATGNLDLFQMHGRDLFLDDPKAALVGLILLGHQLGYFNILPLYIVLLSAALPMLWVGRARPGLMLGASFAIYGASRFLGWNIPTWPMKGTWFFDPFTWQLLMVAGLYVGLILKRREVPQSRGLIAAAVAILALGAYSVTDGFSLQPGLQDWTRSWADLDKTTLGAGRIVHFAALAYLVYAFKIAQAVQTLPAFSHLCRLGRHSLWSFALLSVMAAICQVLADAFGHGVLLDTAMIGGGLVALFGAAALLEARRAVVVSDVVSVTRP